VEKTEMFYALNTKGVRIDAYEADEKEKHVCPICKNPVILKRGSINIAHFAHESNQCEDAWNYDMSEWHKRMQNYFEKDCQEVVVSYKGKKHRADVLIDDIVLEFQFSPITSAEFEDRNEFFRNAGYRLAWVFNLSQISEDT
jgi:competence protein CoiA